VKCKTIKIYPTTKNSFQARHIRAQGRGEKGGGSTWARPRGGQRRRGEGAWHGGQQWPPAVGRGLRRCHANKGGRRPWVTRANVSDEQDRGEAGPGVSGGVRESEGKRGRAAAGC
jgi:hypothetical protein